MYPPVETGRTHHVFWIYYAALDGTTHDNTIRIASGVDLGNTPVGIHRFDFEFLVWTSLVARIGGFPIEPPTWIDYSFSPLLFLLLRGPGDTGPFKTTPRTVRDALYPVRTGVSCPEGSRPPRGSLRIRRSVTCSGRPTSRASRDLLRIGRAPGRVARTYRSTAHALASPSAASSGRGCSCREPQQQRSVGHAGCLQAVRRRLRTVVSVERGHRAHVSCLCTKRRVRTRRRILDHLTCRAAVLGTIALPAPNRRECIWRGMLSARVLNRGTVCNRVGCCDSVWLETHARGAKPLAGMCMDMCCVELGTCLALYVYVARTIFRPPKKQLYSFCRGDTSEQGSNRPVSESRCFESKKRRGAGRVAARTLASFPAAACCTRSRRAN
eukprot:7386424-Prymnesium_polylepis.1